MYHLRIENFFLFLLHLSYINFFAQVTKLTSIYYFDLPPFLYDFTALYTS